MVDRQNKHVRKRIVLISCVSKKLPHQAPARELYDSPLFHLNLKYANKLEPDNIFILSAEYGMLSLDRVIDPYERTLNTMRTSEVKAWASKVLIEIQAVCSIDETEFTFLAGEKYRRFLIPHLKYVKIPLKGLPIGKQLQTLIRLTS